MIIRILNFWRLRYIDADPDVWAEYYRTIRGQVVITSVGRRSKGDTPWGRRVRED